MNKIYNEDDFSVLKQKYQALEAQNELIASEMQDTIKYFNRQKQYLNCLKNINIILSDLESDIIEVFKKIISELKSGLYSEDFYFQIKTNVFKTDDFEALNDYNIISEQSLINDINWVEIRIAFPAVSVSEFSINSNIEKDFLKLILSTIGVYLEKKNKFKSIITEKENQYKNIFQNKHTIMFLLDPETGEIKDVNQAACDFYGWTYQEMCSKKIFDINPISELEMKTEMQKAKQEKRNHFNFKHRLANGEIRDVEVYSGPVTFNNKNLLYSIIHDITDRKAMEIKLQQSEEKYRNIVESINDVVFEITIDGFITYVSPSVYKVLGYTEDEVLGKNIISYIYEEDRSMIIQRLSTLNVKDYLFLEYRYVKKDGSIGWVRSSTNAIAKDGVNIGGRGTLTDITERKIIEENLKISEEKFSKAFSNSPFAFIITSLEEGRIFEVNEAFINISGYTLEDVINNNIFNLNIWVDLEDRSFFIQQLKEKKEVNKLECRFRIKTGEIRIALISASVFYIENMPYILSSINDITNQKKAETELRKSEELYRAIIQASPDNITISDLEGKIIMTSPKAVSMFGYENINQILNRNIAEFLTPQSFEKAQIEIAKMYEGYFAVPDEYKAIKQNGDVFDIEVNADLIRDEEGNPIRMIIIIRDITDRKIAEEKLRQSEEKYRNFFENVQDVYYETSPEGFITEISPSIFTLSQGMYTREDMLNKSLIDLYANPEDRNKFLEVLLKNGKVTDYELKLKLKDGTEKYISISSKLSIDKSDKPEKIFGSLRDITQRKLTEETIRVSEERFRAISENSFSSICILNVAGKVIWINDAMMNTSGYTSEQAYSAESFIAFIHPESLEFVVGNFMKFVNNEKYEHNYQFWLIRADGEKRLFEKYMTHYTDQDGNRNLIISMMDVTERIAAEKGMQKLSQAIDQSLVMTYITDITGTIEYVNPRVVEISGYKNEELIGQNPRIFSSGEKSTEEYAKLWETITSGKEWKGEFHNKKKNGELYWVMASISPVINSNGVISHYIAIEEDITNRKLAEDKISNQNEQLNAIIRAIPDLIFVINKEGIYTDFFSSDKEKLITPINKIIGSSIFSSFDEETAIFHIRKIEECINARKLITYEYEIVINDRICYFDARMAPLGTDKVLTSVRDITDRKEKEIELKKLLQAIEQSPVTIVITDVKGRIEYANPAFEKTSGYSFEEAKGKNPNILKSEKMDNTIYKDLWENISSGKEWRGEWINKRKNGELYWEDVSITPVFSEKGEIINYLAVKQDITQKKQSEKRILELNESLEQKVLERTNELAQTNFILKKEIDNRILADVSLEIEKKRLASIIEGTNVGTWEWNIKSGENIVNERWAEILGYSLDELLPVSIDTWINFIHPDDKNKTIEQIKKHFSGELDYFDSEFRMKNKNGNWIWVLNRGKISKWDTDGKPLLMSGTLQDITEQKQLGELIEQTRINYENFFNTIDDFLFVLDEQGNIIHTNNTVNERLEYNFDELIGKSVLMVHPEERREEAGRIVAEMLAGTADFCPVPLVTKTGNHISVETRVKAGYWNEKPVIFGVTKDISKIKLSEEKFSKAFQSNSALMAISNFENGVLIDVNNLFLKSLGFDRNEVIGKTTADLELFVDQKIRNILIEELKQKISIKDIETEVKAKDGRILTGLFSADIIYVGKDKCMLTVMLDITERKAMEKALKESEARWNFALEGSGDGVWDWNAQTGKLYLSPQWKKLLGYNENDDELLNPDFETWKNRVHPEDIEKCLVYLNKHLKGFTPIYMHEYRILRKDGSYLWVLDRGKTIEKDEKNNPLRVIGTIADISDRKKFEQTLKQSIEREKELNDLKSRFVSMASHEFRTPLASILMYSDILISYWEKMDTIQIFDNLKVIKDQVSHLSAVVADVMQISKIQEGKINFNPQKNDIISLCNNTLLTFNSDIQLKNKIELISDFKEVYIKFDSRLIQQVLNNLISNAIKYSLDDAIIKVIVSTNDDSFQISVKDNGIGIASEDQKHLFEAFFRANNVNNIQGNGLGLNIVKESMKLHGGKVFVESELNKGSIFTISFPMKIVVSYQ